MDLGQSGYPYDSWNPSSDIENIRTENYDPSSSVYRKTVYGFVNITLKFNMMIK